MVLRFTERVGTSGNDSLTASFNTITFGLAGNDVISATSNQDFMLAVGGSGNDTYVLANNSALTIIDAGGGTDTLIASGIGLFSNTSFSYTIDSRHLLAFDTLSGQAFYGLDWLSSNNKVEFIELADGRFSFDFIASNLNSLGNVSWEFLGAIGFQSLITAEVNEAITFYSALQELLEIVTTPAGDAINQIYLNVLRRDADSSGLGFWVAQFNAGLSLNSIRDALVSSSEATGIVDPIVRLYEVAFGRQPDESGLTYWADAINEGASLEEIALGFTGSQEFISRFGSSTDRSAFVENLYVNGLGRASDAPGKAFWVGSAFTDVQLLLGFSESVESIARLDNFITTLLTNLADGFPADALDALTEVNAGRSGNPKLSIAAVDSSVQEGDSGITPFIFTVSRSDGLNGVTTVDWAVSTDGLAFTQVIGAPGPAEPDDFFPGTEFPSGTVTFLAGESEQTISISVSGDTTSEVDDVFQVMLSNLLGGAEITTDTATGTILNDDAVIALLGVSLSDSGDVLI